MDKKPSDVKFAPVGPVRQGTVKIINEHCQMTEVGIQFGTISFDAWVELGQGMGRIHKCLMWYLGDWINYGEARWGEKYSQALSTTDYNYGTLRNASWVCRHIPLEKRRSMLTYGHHVEVVKLEKEEREIWLDRAELEGMTARDLRLAIKGAAPDPETFYEWFSITDIKKFLDGGLSIEDVRIFAEKAWKHGR